MKAIVVYDSKYGNTEKITRAIGESIGVQLRLVGEKTSLAGDRYFFRHYAFLSGVTGGEYMYRFDPSSRVLTRYTRWW